MSASAAHRRATGQGSASRWRRRALVGLAALLLGLAPASPASPAPAGRGPDLAVFSMASLPGSVPVDALVDVRTVVKNVGGKRMSGTVTETLGAGATFHSSLSGCTPAGGRAVSCPVPPIDPGASHTLDVIVRAPATAGTITHTAVLTATSPNDSNAGNDTATASTVVSTVPAACASSGPDCHVAGVVVPGEPVRAGLQRVSAPVPVIVQRLATIDNLFRLCQTSCSFAYSVEVVLANVHGVTAGRANPVTVSLDLPPNTAQPCRGVGGANCPLRVWFEDGTVIDAPPCPGQRGSVTGSGIIGEGQRVCINAQSQNNEVMHYEVLMKPEDPIYH